MAVWVVLLVGKRFEISAEAQAALRGRLSRWANGSWSVERLDLASVNGYEPSPDERAALINAANDVARSSDPADAVKSEVRKLREFLNQQQVTANHQL